MRKQSELPRPPPLPMLPGNHTDWMVAAGMVEIAAVTISAISQLRTISAHCDVPGTRSGTGQALPIIDLVRDVPHPISRAIPLKRQSPTTSPCTAH
jgi:hypothetical protein